MKTLDHSLHHRTPTVAVRDNRGLAVRQVVYHRHPDTPADIDERITRHQFDAFGHPVESIDPRLPTPNFTYQLSMAGETLRTDSVDAGRSIALSDIAGRPLMHLSANDVTRYHQYEPAPLAGRPLSITEGPLGETPRVAERFVWAGNDQASKDHNLAGLPVRHYDTAGRLETDSVALTSLPLSSTRQLLADADEADWQGANEAAWERLLAPETYTTLALADATGTLLEQTDARKHQQHLVYDIAGQLANSWLTLKGGTKQPILAVIEYTAAGQKLSETHGNGVVTTFTYEPRTQRLVHILAVRPADAKRLQDLRYAYDPVGNVIHLHNDAEATRFYRNQKVEPEHHYTYDTLYQLVCATGRELLDIAKREQKNRPITLPSLSTDGTLVNYERHYHYDRGGNLTCLEHNPGADAHCYKIELTVSDRSNRAVDKAVTEDPTQVDAYFDTAGNQRQLQATQQLEWTTRGELARAVLIARDRLAADEETYRYDASSQRVAKQRSDLTSGTLRRSHVLYLPGLELRTQYSDTTVESSRHEIIVGAAGSAQVRVLHWETGLPPGMANDSIRYSHTDLIGSVALELGKDAAIISQEEYYPYGETAVWLPHNTVEADYKTVRYSGKERDATGLYYYGYRYYQPWLGRWLSADPAGTVDGLNLYRMARNNPVIFKDSTGLDSESDIHRKYRAVKSAADLIDEVGSEVHSFLSSKSNHIATRLVFSLATALLVSTYGGGVSLFAKALGVPLPFLKDIVKDSLATAVGAPPSLPSTDISKEVSDKTRSTGEKIIDYAKHKFEFEYILKKMIDKGLNMGAGMAISSTLEAPPLVPITADGEALSFSFPFVKFYDAFESAFKANKLSKDTLIDNMLKSLEEGEKTIKKLHEEVMDGFEKQGKSKKRYRWHDVITGRPPEDMGLAIRANPLLHPVRVEPFIYELEHIRHHRTAIGKINSLKQYLQSEKSRRTTGNEKASM